MNTQKDYQKVLDLYEKAIDLANEQIETVAQLVKLQEIKKQMKKEIKGNA